MGAGGGGRNWFVQMIDRSCKVVFEMIEPTIDEFGKPKSEEMQKYEKERLHWNVNSDTQVFFHAGLYRSEFYSASYAGLKNKTMYKDVAACSKDFWTHSLNSTFVGQYAYSEEQRKRAVDVWGDIDSDISPS